MCGIAAIININSSIDCVSAVKQMGDIIRHRGPDDEGFVLFGDRKGLAEFFGGTDTPDASFSANYRYSPRQRIESRGKQTLAIALAHRRLSITDLSPGGHQPMCTPDGRYSLVFNGEIYNHIELRKELAHCGVRFLTQSDSEVLLHAFHQWGASCLSRFNGMFAFVLYDRMTQRLFIARDRFGVKPLYYWRSPLGYIAIASEIKQFTVLPGWRAKVNSGRAYDYLSWGFSDHTSETMFDGVLQLRGGEYVDESVENISDQLPVKSWYRLDPQPYSGRFNDAVDTLRSLFEDSVRMRMRADVPVGTGLSGGLDSSSIVCMVDKLRKAQRNPNQQKTFSACSSIRRFDERDYIDEVVKHTGVTPYYTYPALQDLFSVMPKITWHQDEPFLSTSIYAEWSVFSLVRENSIKVTLDGHGADELLAGYHTFYEPHFSGLLRSRQFGLLGREILAAKRIHGYGILNAVALLSHNIMPEVAMKALRGFLGRDAVRKSWLNTKILSDDGVSTCEDLRLNSKSVNSFSSFLLNRTSLPVQLHWADRDSMAHSVEARAPFLDYRLVELISSLPGNYKLANGTTKYILRQAMSGILPNRIRTRMDKMGFVTPEEIWIRHTDPNAFRKAVRDAVDQSSGLILPSSIKLVDDFLSGKTDHQIPVWRIINFSIWMEQFRLGVS